MLPTHNITAEPSQIIVIFFFLTTTQQMKSQKQISLGLMIAHYNCLGFVKLKTFFLTAAGRGRWLFGFGSARDFFLLKGTFSFHRHLGHAQDGRLNRREVLMQCCSCSQLGNFFFFFLNQLCMNWTNLEFNEFGLIVLQ